VGLRLAWGALLLSLRVLAAQPPSVIAQLDAPPPPLETRIAAVDDDASDDDGDDPSDLDDDDSDDDVALPTSVATAAPGALEVRMLWSIHLLSDKHTRDPLFRPPRRA
jgi:hypothetical protein